MHAPGVREMIKKKKQKQVKKRKKERKHVYNCSYTNMVTVEWTEIQ